MKRSIVFLDAYTLNPGDLNLDGFSKFGSVQLYDRTPEDLVISRSKNASILLLNKVKITRAILEQLPKLEYIGIAATGYDNVDIQACNELGITVTNVRDYSTASVAQSVFAHILNITNATGQYVEEVKKGIWSDKEDFSYWHQPIIELNGKTIGILGYGKIGRRVAKIALAFGMNVIIYNRSKIVDLSIKQVLLEELLRESDIISLHIPLSENTKDIVNHSFLERMKKTTILINTARGGLIKNEDLIAALNNGIIRAAGIDVLDQEPPSNNHPLIQCKHCYVTPHQAWASLESRMRLLEGMINNIKGFEDGKPINIIGEQ